MSGRAALDGLHMAAAYQPRLDAVAVMFGADVLRIPLGRVEELIGLMRAAQQIGMRAHPLQIEAGVGR